MFAEAVCTPSARTWGELRTGQAVWMREPATAHTRQDEQREHHHDQGLSCFLSQGMIDARPRLGCRVHWQLVVYFLSSDTTPAVLLCTCNFCALGVANVLSYIALFLGANVERSACLQVDLLHKTYRLCLRTVVLHISKTTQTSGRTFEFSNITCLPPTRFPSVHVQQGTVVFDDKGDAWSNLLIEYDAFSAAILIMPTD